ncbi:hypothetical protein [Lampropedia aestuarii]|uniref:hypothetical protein n=1 Tax=Lampropedia aestuarii TaxID=2562762 RepID=UPI001456217A|nr:hypothetical protein [Lampropedia aestuarii]
MPVFSPQGAVVAGLAVIAVANRMPERHLPSLVAAMTARAQAIGEGWARQSAARPQD